jgi:hypothetical protein
MTESKKRVWYLIVDDKRDYISRHRSIIASSDAWVDDLTTVITNTNPNTFAKVDFTHLKMWKWPGGFAVKRQGTLVDQISDFHEKEGVRLLEPEETLDGLKWSSEDDLLVAQIAGFPTSSTSRSLY